MAEPSSLPCHVSVASELAAPASRVWAWASRMEGVNAELSPWVRMTVPPRARGKRLDEAPLGEPLFASWILAGGVLPIDRHHFQLETVREGYFREWSSSWLQAVWCHERHVRPTPSGCRVIDEVRFQPRLALLGPLIQRIVQAVFEHRHRRLRAASQDGSL